MNFIINPTKKASIIFITFFLFVGGVILTQCSENTTEPEVDEEFDIEYILINNGDSSITAMTIVARTYWPKQNEAREMGRQKDFVAPYDTIRYLPARDSTLGDPLYLGYVGCITLIGARIYKKWDGDEYKYWHYWYLNPDTIKSIEDRIITFYWPDDTSFATKLW